MRGLRLMLGPCVTRVHLTQTTDAHNHHAQPKSKTKRKGRSGRLYLRRSRHVTAEEVLEVDRASIHLSPDEARLLSLER